MLSEIAKTRLQQLADGFKCVKDKDFDYAEWIMSDNYDDDAKLFQLLQAAYHGDEHTCGTTGCMIGYTPVIFPADWAVINGYPRLRTEADSTVSYSIRVFFDLDNYEAEYLFLPKMCERNFTVAQAVKKLQDFIDSDGLIIDDID